MSLQLSYEDQVELIRALKSAQTDVIQQGLMIAGLEASFRDDADSIIHDELLDALTTAMNHKQALAHIIKRLETPVPDGVDSTRG